MNAHEKLITAQQRQIDILTRLNESLESEVRTFRAKDAWVEAARERPQDTLALLESEHCPLLPPGWEFDGVMPVKVGGERPPAEPEPAPGPPHILDRVARERGLL